MCWQNQIEIVCSVEKYGFFELKLTEHFREDQSLRDYSDVTDKLTSLVTWERAAGVFAFQILSRLLDSRAWFDKWEQEKEEEWAGSEEEEGGRL